MSKIFFKTSRVVKVEFHDRKKSQQWAWGKHTNAQGEDQSGFYWGSTRNVFNDNKPLSREDVEDKGLIVDKDNIVYNLSFVNVFLEHGETVTRNFYDSEEAENWAEDLMTDKGYSEIISFNG